MTVTITGTGSLPNERDLRSIQNPDAIDPVIMNESGRRLGAPASVPGVAAEQAGDANPLNEERKLPGNGGAFPFQPGP